MAHSPEQIRNVVVIGSGGAGKTTLVEALLHKCKMTTRRGSIQEKNTVTDWDDDEKEREQSLLATPVHLTWDNHTVQLIDTPGALDFAGEAISAMAAAETAVLVVNAHDGVGVATRRLFRAARDQGLAVVIVINRIEGDNIEPDALYTGIQEALGERAVPLNLPNAFGGATASVHDVYGTSMPDELQDQAKEFAQQTTDRVVECDDALLERYFESGTIDKKELAEVFPRALRQGNIVPVLHVSSDKDVGQKKLLDFIAADCPPPMKRTGMVIRAAKAGDDDVEVKADGSFSAQVWKIHVDPHVGKVAYLRVWSGSLASKSQFVVTRTGKTERIGDLLSVHGKDMKAVDTAAYGDLVAVAKVDDIQIGDTVHDGNANWTFGPMITPYPKVTLAVEPKNRADETKIAPELQKLADADATFIAEREEATGEFVIRGLSTLHLDIMLKRLGRKKVEAITHLPRIPYFETVTGTNESSYRHKKQSGGRGQFAEVHLRVSPLPRGDQFQFVDEVVGGAIPRNFIPAVEKGIMEQCTKGVVAGYPFIDVKAAVFFGKFHDVDSDEFSFKLAGAAAFREAVTGAKPVLLEPVMKVSIEVPSRFMGDISGDLNSRRGRISSMNQEGDLAIIEATVPLSEIMQYSTELRSLTAGEGDYDFSLDHYDVVPAHVAKGVIAKSERERVAT